MTGLNDLLDLVAAKSAPGHAGEMQEAILGMICNESQPMPLSAQELHEALETDGEFLVLRLGYDEVAEELRENRLEETIREALSILISFEDDGGALETIERFIRHFHERLDPRQNFRFGIRRTRTLSDAPVTILFAGILPINQLKITVGTRIAQMIEADRAYFEPRFRELRERLSEEIGIPILPVATDISETIPPGSIRLVDPSEDRVLCRFDVTQPDREGIENYLMKIYYIYLRLWRERGERHPADAHSPAPAHGV